MSRIPDLVHPPCERQLRQLWQALQGDTPGFVMDRRERAYLRKVYVAMRQAGLEPPQPDDVMFARFALRHGFSPISPEREARLDAMYAEYARQASEPEPVLATVLQFPIVVEPSAEVFELHVERARRREGG